MLNSLPVRGIEPSVMKGNASRYNFCTMLSATGVLIRIELTREV